MLIPGRMYKRIKYNTDSFTVGSIYKAVDGYAMIDNGGTRVGTQSEYWELQPESKMASMDYASLELRVAAQLLKENQMDYQFSVSSDKLIDIDEIRECLTREHPMAIVHRSDGMHTVVIHGSIYQKLDLISKAILQQFNRACEPYDMSPDDFVPTAGGCLTPIIQAVRAVRNAKVLVGIPCTVKVVFPEI